jgi:hypothetical protein
MHSKPRDAILQRIKEVEYPRRGEGARGYKKEANKRRREEK